MTPHSFAGPHRPQAAAAPACALTEQRANELLDDELDADTTATLRAHLAECPPCRAVLARVQRFLGAVRRQRLRTEPCPESLRRRVDTVLDAAMARAAAADAALAAGLTAGVARCTAAGAEPVAVGTAATTTSPADRRATGSAD